MPIDTLLVIVAVVSAFTLFGLVLAWGDRQTRGRHSTRQPAE